MLAQRRSRAGRKRVVSPAQLQAAETLRSCPRSLAQRRLVRRANDWRWFGPIAAREEPGDEIDGKREDDGGVFFRADFGQRLQIAKLDAERILVDDRRRLSELLAGLQLALGVDHLRALLAFGLGLAGHGPLHRLRQLDVLDLDDADLDAPRL